MKIPRNELDNLRLQYESVADITYRIGTEESSIVVRKPKFDEYIYFNKHVINYAENTNAQPNYELDPDVADIFFKRVVVYPETIDINRIPAGLIHNACIKAIELCDFEKPEVLRQMYVTSVKNAHTVVGLITQRLLVSYGIQAFTALKYLSEEEIMDLVVISEVVNGDLGMLAKVTEMKDMPFTRRGKLDLKSLMGISNVEQKQYHPYEKHLKDKARTYYKRMGVPDERIEQLLKERESLEGSNNSKDDFEIIDDDTQKDKIDLNTMNENDLKNMSRQEYAKLKKERKLTSFEDSVSQAMQKSKSALAKKIEEDRARYGENKHKEITEDKLQDLLRVVKDKTRDIE